MKPMLFRLKIALLSVLLSGVVLVGFGLFSLGVIHRLGVDRIDREIRSFGERQLHGPRPVGYWAALDRSLRVLRGSNSPPPFALQVLTIQGEVIHRSSNCPAVMLEAEVPVLRMLPPPHPAISESPPSPLPTREPQGAAFFRRFDRDGDGRIAADEFDGPPFRFAERDLNHDGFIDPVEMASPPPGGRTPREPLEPAQRRPVPGLGERLPERMQLKAPVFRTFATPEGKWRVGFMGNREITLMVGVNMADVYLDATRYRQTFLVTVPIVLLLLGASGWLLATRALRPVAAISATAEHVTAQGLHQRVPTTNADAELAHLVAVINGMLERLERSYGQAVRFSADAAHELQTPLTVLQGELDDALQGAQPGSEEQRRYSGLLEEVQYLKTVMQKLLLLAQADAGRLALNREPVNLSDLLLSAAEDVTSLAPTLRVQQDVPPNVVVSADSDLLRQAVRNMVTNAVKYSLEGGMVRFRLEVQRAMARFTLSNTSAPIPTADRDRIFDRFHRVDKSRNRRLGGAGLGLSLAREIARAHEGDLILEPDPDGLTAFTLTLPLKRPP